MHRYSRHSDYYPAPTDAPRTHTCGATAHDHGCHIWNAIGAKGGTVESQITAVRDHSLKKVLPWRAKPSKEDISDTSYYTGRGLAYKPTSDIYGTPMIYKFPDLVTASNVCASHANKTHLGAKFSPSEWTYSNQQLYTGAECVHNTTMMMGADAENTITDTLKDQVRCAADTSKDIDNRLNDIQKWAQNEKQELQYNISQTHELLQLKERVETMLKNLETPLNITQENIYAREARPGVELVRDAVEESLLREVEIIRKCENSLMDQINRINDQLTKLRAARHELEVDIRNKEEARNTDECVKQLSGLSLSVGHVNVPENQLAKSSPVSWLQNCQALIQRSQDERHSTQVLHGEVNRVMMLCSDQCYSIWFETNTCLNSRIKEICSARDHLQRQYNKIIKDIEHLNHRMNDVRKALDEKKPALKLAQARAEKRTQRPGIELCHDKVAIALFREIHTLQVAIEKLANQLDEMETTMQQLMKTKSSLERDLKLKDMALFIDREKCLQMRQQFPVSSFRNGISKNGPPPCPSANSRNSRNSRNSSNSKKHGNSGGRKR